MVRFRRSLKIASGLRLNLTKGGLGLSAGKSGARIGFGPRGPYVSGGIPGTGLYSINYFQKQQKDKRDGDPTLLPPELAPRTSLGCFGAIIIVFSLILYAPLGIFLLLAGGVWIALQERKPRAKARRLVMAGEKDWQKGNLERSSEKMAQAWSVYPIPAVAGMAGELFFFQQNYRKAKKYLEEYLKDEEDSQARLMLFLSCKESGENKRALENLQNLPIEIKQEMIVLVALAEIYLEQGRPELAREVLGQGPLRKRKIEDPLTKHFIYLSGVVFNETGNENRAKTQFRKVFALDPGYLNIEKHMQELGEI